MPNTAHPFTARRANYHVQPMIVPHKASTGGLVSTAAAMNLMRVDRVRRGYLYTMTEAAYCLDATQCIPAGYTGPAMWTDRLA